MLWDMNVEFRHDRLAQMMKIRDLNQGQLEYLSGVGGPMISLLLAGKRPNVSAVIAAKPAKTLNCAVEYLLGMVDERAPKALEINDLLLELTEVAKHLTNRRQRDLPAMARTYLEMAQTQQATPEQLQGDLFDLIEEALGTRSRDQLIRLLEADANASAILQLQYSCLTIVTEYAIFRADRQSSAGQTQRLRAAATDTGATVPKGQSQCQVYSKPSPKSRPPTAKSL